MPPKTRCSAPATKPGRRKRPSSSEPTDGQKNPPTASKRKTRSVRRLVATSPLPEHPNTDMVRLVATSPSVEHPNTDMVRIPAATVPSPENTDSDADIAEGAEVEAVVGPIPIDDGAPTDLSLLVDYPHHIAYKIWTAMEEMGVVHTENPLELEFESESETSKKKKQKQKQKEDHPENRELTFRHHYVRYTEEWKLDDEIVEIQEWVRKAGLRNLVDFPVRYLDRVLISAFIERWYPETNTFHLPFGEMTITLHDVDRILRIPMEGRPVTLLAGEKSKAEYSVMFVEQLGVSQADVEIQFKKGPGCDLKWLKDTFMGCNPDAPQIAKERAGRAYMMYLLGSTLFSDKSGSRVHARVLEVVMDIDMLGTYSWGPSALCWLYRHLGLASRAGVRQMGSFLPLLEAWILDYFMFRNVPNPLFRAGEHPTVYRWLSHPHTGEDFKGQLQGLREILDNLGPESVDWMPLEKYYDIHKMTWYSGCIVVFDIAEAYHPDRVKRQMGYIQDIPNAPIPTLRQKTNRLRHGREYKVGVDYQPHVRFQHQWENHVVREESRGNSVRVHPWDMTREYYKWYKTVSHLQVQPDARRLTGPVMNPTQWMVDQAHSITEALQFLSVGNMSAARDLLLSHDRAHTC